MMATHPFTTTSNIVFSRSHMVNTEDWHPSNKVMATPLKSYESPPLMLYDNHRCPLTITSLYNHNPTRHHLIKIIISNHPDSPKSCVMTQIWMLHDNPSISTISPNSQTTFSSRSIYHRIKLTSGLTISDST